MATTESFFLSVSLPSSLEPLGVCEVKKKGERERAKTLCRVSNCNQMLIATRRGEHNRAQRKRREKSGRQTILSAADALMQMQWRRWCSISSTTTNTDLVFLVVVSWPQHLFPPPSSLPSHQLSRSFSAHF